MLLQLTHPVALLADAAQAAGPAAPKADQPSGLAPLFLIGMLVIVFYLMIMRPQRRDQARRREMLEGVKQNDHIVTIGGIYGVVTNVHREADQVTIKIDESTNTKIRVTVSAIARIVGDEPSNEDAKK
jgi:preprotein translocase subunit YajC